MSVKIKSILHDSDHNGMLCTSWLEKQNVTRAEQIQYVRFKGGWGVLRILQMKPDII